MRLIWLDTSQRERSLESLSEAAFRSERAARREAVEDSSRWSAFAEAGTTAAFCQAWLALLCEALPGAQAALLLIEQNDAFAPAAVWPAEGRDVLRLKRAAEETLRTRAGVALPAENEAGAVHFGYPVVVRDRLHGAIVVDVAARGAQDVTAVWRRLHWGAGWLETLFWRTRTQELEQRAQRLTAALDVLAVAQEPPSASASAAALAGELTMRLQCDRVAIGWRQGDALVVRAISHATRVEKRARFVDALANAMDEALDQNAALVHPPLPETERRVAVALRTLAQAHGYAGALVAIMPGRDGAFGAVVALRREASGFDAEKLRLAESVALLAGPFLEQKAAADRFISGRAPRALSSAWVALFGHGRPTVKAAALAALVGLALLSLAEAPDRISTKATLEGAVQRAAVAPFDGFVAEAPVRAGEVVAAGALLARLDDKDLELDKRKWSTEHDKSVQKMREASAEHDRAAFAIHAAEAQQAEAQAALAEDRLARARVTSPIDGMVVSGDLSQLLGSPVERGKVLFEIAPLSAYRVVMQADERDVRRISVGQPGTLLLSGLPDEPLPITVSRVISVATAEEGHNFFRVEAELGSASTSLRPGMEGVAKLDLGRAGLIPVWTRGFRDWLKLQWWLWKPT